MNNLLSRKQAMEKLQLKSSFFSKICNGKVKGLPPIPVARFGRRVMFRECELDKWVAKVEENCAGQ